MYLYFLKPFNLLHGELASTKYRPLICMGLSFNYKFPNETQSLVLAPQSHGIALSICRFPVQNNHMYVLSSVWTGTTVVLSKKASHNEFDMFNNQNHKSTVVGIKKLKFPRFCIIII